MHVCHAIACTEMVPPKMLMCRKHWFSVPKIIRDQVMAHYRSGQIGDWKPSKEYCEAAKAALRAAAENEGRVVTGQENEMKFYEVLTAYENPTKSKEIG